MSKFVRFVVSKYSVDYKVCPKIKSRRIVILKHTVRNNWFSKCIFGKKERVIVNKFYGMRGVWHPMHKNNTKRNQISTELLDRIYILGDFLLKNRRLKW